jgi:signal transduction histidine kinase
MPDSISALGANAALAAAAILLLEATREYCGLRPWVLGTYAGGILAVLGVAYFRYVVRNLNGSIVTMSAFMGAVAILSARTLLQEWRARRRMSAAVSVVMFAMSAVLLMTRAIYFLLAPPLADVLAPTLINGAFFVGCALSIACCSIGWIQLTHERVPMDLKEAQSRVAIVNREVAEARQRASAADASRSAFLETVNHEIRNPLGGVMAATDLLLDTELTREQQECALAVRMEAETLLKVNENLVDLSEIEAGRVAIESVAFDLRGVIEEAAEIYAHVARNKDIDLVVDYAAGIPRRFYGDSGKIRQVLMNLVWNAVRFTSSGQVVVAVECEVREAHHPQMRVSVTDRGSAFHWKRSDHILRSPLRALPGHRGARAARSGALEIWISPSKGLYISRIRRIAQETDSAETNKLATTVVLAGANTPKLMKIIVSHKTRMTSSGKGTEPVLCSYINRRVCPRLFCRGRVAQKTG